VSTLVGCPRGPEYRYDHQTQTTRWYLYDGLGSILGEVDPSGTLTASRKYNVYGLVRSGHGDMSRHGRCPAPVEGFAGSVGARGACVRV